MKRLYFYPTFGTFLVLMTSAAFAQRVAILAPDKSARDLRYAEMIASSLSRSTRILDLSQSAAAFRSLDTKTPYNMTAAQSRAAASVMGSEYFLVVRTGGLRRESFTKPEYYEAYSVIFLVSGRTGLLAGWWLKSFEAEDQSKADQKLVASIDATAQEIADRARNITSTESRIDTARNIEDVPDEKSPAAEGLKPPIPYRRLKPQYTSMAALYEVKATVELEADIDADGKILATRILRWAGFGLDESVDAGVRSMNWRPAMRNGKPLPMRILLRYNFTKLDTQ